MAGWQSFGEAGRWTEGRRGVSNPDAQLHICNYNLGVTEFRFERDEAKNLSNRRKHGVSFEEASQVFLDLLHNSEGYFGGEKEL